MNNFKIVEYDDRYAESLAKMWNMSSDNWGGYDHLITAKDIKAELKNNGHINDYLAVEEKNGEVVGYCCLSEYREDENSLYIPLLNVRPDYQGRKIGKALVLKIVERTRELGWPRVDLYTWSGNTKAVPLYKKCGFFWEKRDDSTHLMNFIPAVHQCEALTPYLKEFDWYQDSQRSLEIEPDGSKEDNFNHFEYKWKNKDCSLRVGFERRSRGMNLIETDDYLIEATLEDDKPVFGRDYKVRYKIVNKNKEPLKIKIEGIDDKNIKYSFSKKVEVKEEKTVEGSYYVEQSDEKVKDSKTQPAVRAILTINGLKANLAAGLKFCSPLEMDINIPDIRKYRGIRSEFYLDLENGYDQEAIFSFRLPGTPDLSLLKKEFKFKLKERERRSLTIPYFLLNNCYYNPCLEIEVELEDGYSFSYTQRLGEVFRGRSNKFGGETDRGWILCNGPHSVCLEKGKNRLVAVGPKGETPRTGIISPKLGLPYSNEFSRLNPDKIEFFSEGEDYCLRAIFISENMDNIHLIWVVKLSPDGLVENSYKVFNLGEKETEKEIYLSQAFQHILVDTYLPYDGKIIEIDGWDGFTFDYWSREKIDENWFFSRGEGMTRGIVWPADYDLKFKGWHNTAEVNLGQIPAGESKETGPLYLACGVFDTWEDIRQFALGDINPPPKESVKKFQLSINDGNPFVKGDFPIDFKEHRNKNLKAQVRIKGKNNKIIQKSVKVEEDDNKKTPITLTETGMELLDIDICLNASERKETKGIFIYNDGEIKCHKRDEKDEEVFMASNGFLTIKNAPNFSHALFSLQDQDGEWLDSTFPDPGPKSWWNPWAGGCIHRPEEMSKSTLLGEESKAQFTKLRDNYSNPWEGIKVTTEIKNSEKYKGLTLNHYYLLLPSLGVLCTLVEIVQKTGRYFNQEKFVTEGFIKPEKELKKSWLKIRNLNGEWIKYFGGQIGFQLKTDFSPFFGGENRKKNLLIYSGAENSDYFCYANLDIIGGNVDYRISCPDGDRVFSPPVFYILTPEFINPDILSDLRKIDFNKS